MKKLILIILILCGTNLFAQRLKDITFLSDKNSQQLIGYGLVVGLAGTGDTYRTKFTVQSISSMLKRFGITVPQKDMRTRNVAAVMVTATLNPFLKPGSKFSVNVSSMGDASSLLGGILLLTPLSGITGKVYGFSQGPVTIGGYDFRTASGGRVSKNHALAGRVANGGVLKSKLNVKNINKQELTFTLNSPDITTAANISTAINAKIGSKAAKTVDASQVKIKVPTDKQNDIYGFIAELEALNIQTDSDAKVVLNERTGTIVAGKNVIIKPCTITYGSINIVVRSYPIISQPGPFSQGKTTVFNNLVPKVKAGMATTVPISKTTNVQQIASALNSLKVTPKIMIAIFQALKEADALVGKLVIM